MTITTSKGAATIQCESKDTVVVVVEGRKFTLTAEAARDLSEALSACMCARAYMV